MSYNILIETKTYPNRQDSHWPNRRDLLITQILDRAPDFLGLQECGPGQVPELRAALDRAREAGATARALVVINPGNPTGQSLPKEVVAMILRFAAAEGLVRSRSARSHPKRAVP